MIVRPATPQDLAAIRRLEEQTDSAAHWSEHDYAVLFQPGALPRVVLLAAISESEELGEGFHGTGNESPALDYTQQEHINSGGQELVQHGAHIVGFVVVSCATDEWELENIVVSAEHRRQGVASRLLEGVVARARADEGSAVLLEVRASNVAARRLYEMLGFQQDGYRRAYYRNPREDAFLFRLPVTKVLQNRDKNS